MSDYISRQALRERLGIDPDGNCEKCRYRGAFGCNQGREHVRACEAIDDEPAADVRPVVRAHWIDTTFSHNASWIFPYKCDQCGDTNERKTNFCPNCGAYMKPRKETADG